MSTCPHRNYTPGTNPVPSVCGAGVRYADVTVPKYDAHGRDRGPIWNREPCAETGRANGATCPRRPE